MTAPPGFPKEISLNRYVEGLVDANALPKSTGTFTGDYDLYRLAFPKLFQKWEGAYMARAARIRLGVA